MLSIEKCTKSLNPKINKLNNALKVFDRNKMPPLYKEDNSIFILQEMKAYKDQAQKKYNSFANLMEDNFEDKFPNFHSINDQDRKMGNKAIQDEAKYCFKKN